MSAKPFRLNPALDIAVLQARFARAGRLRIENFLAEDGARKLAEALVADTRWLYVVNGAQTVFEIPRANYDALGAAERAQIEKAVFDAATRGFQFRYETIRVPDGRAARRRSATLLDGFAQFMSAPETLSFLAAVTGATDLAFSDAQATRYARGDFLTRHDDNVADKHRRLAYVLSLTPEWRAEWGGLLLFNDAEGEVVETIVPRFNALSLFTVPQSHSVSYVSPNAAHPRISVTGWVRSRHSEEG